MTKLSFSAERQQVPSPSRGDRNDYEYLVSYEEPPWVSRGNPAGPSGGFCNGLLQAG